MREVFIQRLRITPDGRLRLHPAGSAVYPQIYRTASSVRWDPERCELYVLEVPGFDAVAEFRQIIAAVAEEYGDKLLLTPGREYVNVPDGLADEFA